MDELSGDISLTQEVFDKVRGMEGKLEYQIKKLIGLADAEEKRGREVIDDAEEGTSIKWNANIGRLTCQTHCRSGLTLLLSHLYQPARPQLRKLDRVVPPGAMRKS